MLKKLTSSYWPLVIALVFIPWGIDYVTKQIALSSINSVSFFGIFGFAIHKNPGTMLGTFSDLPPILRIVSLSVSGIFIVFIYSAIQYLLPKRSLLLRCGMSILLGGILGNVTDRIISGAVTDFVFIRLGTWNSPIFNFSDAIQWVGYGMVIFSLLAYGEEIWPSKNDRKQIWVIPSYQLKYISTLIFIGIGFSLISGVFTFTFMKIVIDELALSKSVLMEKRFLAPFLITFSIICVSFILFLYMVGRIISHRTAGPIFAFENYVKDIISGSERKLKFRDGDELLHLEELADEIKLVVDENHQLKDEIENLQNSEEKIKLKKV